MRGRGTAAIWGFPARILKYSLVTLGREEN